MRKMIDVVEVLFMAVLFLSVATAACVMMGMLVTVSLGDL